MYTKTFKNIMMLSIFSIVSVILFAATGGKKKGNTITTKKVATLKQSTHNLTLRSGYQFKGSKLMSFDNAAQNQFVSLNNYTTIKKGNTNYVVASRHILKTTPTVSVQSNGNTGTTVEMKLLKLKLN
jgi:hypothetical protein